MFMNRTGEGMLVLILITVGTSLLAQYIIEHLIVVLL